MKAVKSQIPATEVKANRSHEPQQMQKEDLEEIFVWE